jgi:hypothetical protein
MGQKKPIVKKLIFVLLAVEMAYLVLFNVILSVPLTQTLINQIKPDKFYVSWESAWTWYPFRIHIRGASGNGQSRSQQWEFDAGEVTASIDLVPLIFKRVWIDDVIVRDASYQQRPRFKADKDYTQIVDFFPPISGREMTRAVTTPKKKKRAWHVDIDDIHLSGEFDYWIHQFRGRASGALEADLQVVSRGGPFSMTAPNVDLEFGPHYLNGTYELFRQGKLSGELGFAPFVPRENKGIKLLKFVLLDVDISVDANSLSFIDVFTQNFNQMTVDGRGLVDGRLHMKKGRVLEPTKLSIDAKNIDVNVLSLNIEGQGAIDIGLGPETNGVLDLKVSYDGLLVTHEDDEEPLLKGRGLEFGMQGDGNLFRIEGVVDPSKKFSLDIDGLSVPDLAGFQRYLPEKWPLRLYGGNGDLQGRASVSIDAASMDFRITSDAAEIGNNEYRFSTNLDVALKSHNPALRTGPTFVSGSYIKITGASLIREGGTESKPWHAEFVIENGNYSIFSRKDKAEKEDVVDLFKMLGKSEARQFLGNSTGSLEISSTISSLAWIGVLMDERYHSSTSGSGTIKGILNLDEGMPAEGTNLEIKSDELVMTILDYIASGNGKIVFQVEEGGERPDWLIQVDLTEGNLKRPDETVAKVRDVDLALRAHIEDMSFEKRSKYYDLEFSIPSAYVDDMAMFNDYFPPDLPVRLTRGSAVLVADIRLKHDDADGFVSLKADGLEAIIDGQSLSADFRADISLVDGVPADMMFDISGSEFRLDNVRVLGENKSFNEKDWDAVLTLVRADASWNDPPLLQAEADLSMTDSRPIVAMLGNQEDRPKWVQNMLTIEDINGKMELDIANDQIVIPYAFIDSDNIDFGVKAVIDEKKREGVIYGRYKKLHLLVKINDGKKNIDLLGAKAKFDEYRPPVKHPIQAGQ